MYKQAYIKKETSEKTSENKRLTARLTKIRQSRIFGRRLYLQTNSILILLLWVFLLFFESIDGIKTKRIFNSGQQRKASIIHRWMGYLA